MFLIIGCGFLGSCVAESLRKLTDERIFGTVTDLNNAPPWPETEILDITDKEQVDALERKYKNEKLRVFYSAAMHNIDKVFENPGKGKEVNEKALSYFLSRFGNIERLIFSSTDCVYGENDFAVENSPLRPVSEYGRQKAAAEKIVIDAGFTSARLPLMLGNTPSGKSGFYDNCIRKLETGQTIEMLEGYTRSALTYAQTGELIAKLLVTEEEIPPVLNVCGDDELSKYAIGLMIAEKIGADPGLVIKLPAENGEKFYKDKRAMKSLMDNSLLKKILNLKEIKLKF